MKPIRRRSASSHGFFRGLLLGTALVLSIALLLVIRHNIATSVCANSISCVGDLSGSFVEGKTNTFMGRIVPYPSVLARLPAGTGRVLGETTEPKHIYVDLSTQKLTAFEGQKLVFTFPVATGKWHPTPTGDFRIWIKLRYTHMEGGNPADGTYYNLYNVPYTMFFASTDVPRSAGYSIHGAYWHDNFGHPMSHGCVNMRPEDAALLFAWADPVSTGPTTYASPSDPGTVVTIFGAPPVE